jgi:hypothetical protein
LLGQTGYLSRRLVPNELWDLIDGVVLGEDKTGWNEAERDHRPSPV